MDDEQYNDEPEPPAPRQPADALLASFARELDYLTRALAYIRTMDAQEAA
jgi:hypothetical protein